MATLYAKKEPTKDATLLKITGGDTQGHKDTVLYKDEACAEVAAVIPWHHANCPDRRYKYTMLNCYRYKIVWCD